MDRRFRRALVLAGVLILALAGCGGDGGDDDSADPEDLSGNRVGAMDDYGVGDQFTATEPLTFSMLYNNHPNYPIQEDWLFWEELEKRTNVTLETVEVPLSDYNQRRSVMIGSGDAPFIIPKTYPSQEEPFVSSGAILPVSDYLDLMPNLSDKIQKWDLEADLNERRQADGKFYLLPGVHEVPRVDYSFVVRTDILAELGLEIPETLEDFHDMLSAMKEAYPDSYPFTGRWNQSPPAEPGGNLLRTIGEAFGTTGGWAYGDGVLWDPDAEEHVFQSATDEYRGMIEYLHTLFEEGLMDPESFTQDDDLARQKMASGQSFVSGGNAQVLVREYRSDFEATLPNATLVKIPVPIGPAGEVIPNPSSSRLENGIMISSRARESENFVAMMQFIDWLWYSDEGQKFAKWGVEGVTYTEGPDGPELAEDVDVIGLHPDAPKHLQEDFGFYNGVFAYGGNAELVRAFVSEEEQEFQAVMDTREPMPVSPPHPFTDEEREQATLWATPLKDHVFQNTLRFILGERPLSEWDAYVAELEGLGMTQYMDLVHQAYERYKSKTG